METHPAGATTFVHVDLYRLRDRTETEGLGLRECLAPGRVLLIEWPERGAATLPTPDLQIRLVDHGDGRRASIESGTDVGATWLRYLASDDRTISYLSNLT
ncbi:MAG: tRNA (adenosine(37)-N6)-threonylcarbamoyltransferase complex ATPase subunit type 1 TsaE [Gammaproteobacteria bacterium]|nr:tRNA (adenosine(37)-N6)-threonylcarbamoyltransferase complex ATPase subunit type 1 TsaE [Gammaproteobacteria bacterium]